MLSCPAGILDYHAVTQGGECSQADIYSGWPGYSALRRGLADVAHHTGDPAFAVTPDYTDFCFTVDCTASTRPNVARVRDLDRFLPAHRQAESEGIVAIPRTESRKAWLLARLAA